MHYIAILRGINVGTGRKVPMADLKLLCGKLGLEKIQTYIQSGNMIFELAKPESITSLQDRLQQAISEKFGFDIPVIIRTSKEWADAIATNPFFQKKDGEEGRIYLTFLQNEPSKESLEKIQRFQYLPDQFEIIGREVYIYCKSGYGTSKLSNPFFESKLKVAATTRNWNTVMKLYEMVTS